MSFETSSAEEARGRRNQRLSLAGLAILAASLGAGGSSSAGGRTPSTPPTSASAPASAELLGVRAALLERVRKGDTPSLAVGVARDKRILWAEALGWADRESRVAATTRTLYPVASVSKSITATGVLALAATGKIQLDRPVLRLFDEIRLPETGESADGLLASHLLAHTSGIPHLWHYEYSDRPQTMIGRRQLIRDYAFLASPPGERFLYTNLGYGVLAEILERAGGAPFQEVMAQTVFRPLGMLRTSVEAWVGGPGAARGYDSGGKAIRYRYRLSPDGGAGFFSNVEDLLRYGQFHVGALEATVAARSAGIAADLGLLPPGGHYLRGWGVVHLTDSTVVISDGEMAGGTAAVVLVPERRLVVVVLSNSTGGPAAASAVTILTALVPGFGEQFASATKKIEDNLSAPGVLPTGRFQGSLTDGSERVSVSADFRSPTEPLLRLRSTSYLFQVTGWERGALLASVEGSLPLGIGKGSSHRLLFTLWRYENELRGIAQEELIADRPLYGRPHFVTLKPSPEP